MIRAAILALAAVVTSFPWSTKPVEAREAQWCAVIATSDDSVYWDCQYYSFEQCRSVVLAGNRMVQSSHTPPGAAEEAQGPRPQLLNIATSA
jgi:hypothetical protein